VPLLEPRALHVARHFESRARIFVFAAGAPLAIACRGRAPARLLLFLGRLGRFPQPPALEPPQRGVGLCPLQLAQGRQEIFRAAGAKRRRRGARDDDPEGMMLRH
jgi:hypothetical protein